MLFEARDAMRRHATDMEAAIRLAKSGGPTEEQRRNFTVRLVTSFNDAQSAWDVYRDHLIGHGLLPPATRPAES
jgi:hypothetical protein